MMKNGAVRMTRAYWYSYMLYSHTIKFHVLNSLWSPQVQTIKSVTTRGSVGSVDTPSGPASPIPRRQNPKVHHRVHNSPRSGSYDSLHSISFVCPVLASSGSNLVSAAVMLLPHLIFFIKTLYFQSDLQRYCCNSLHYLFNTKKFHYHQLGWIIR
jgi:hypothetical protein